MSLLPAAIEERREESGKRSLAWVREFRSETAQLFDGRSAVQRLPRVVCESARSTLPLAEYTYK